MHTARNDDEARALLTASIFRSAVRQQASDADRLENEMAKKSSIEKNKPAPRMTKKYSGRRSRLRAIARDKTKAGGGAVRRHAQACRDAAQLVGHAASAIVAR